MLMLLLERAVSGWLLDFCTSPFPKAVFLAQLFLLSVVEKPRGFHTKQPPDHDSQVSCTRGGKYRQAGTEENLSEFLAGEYLSPNPHTALSACVSSYYPACYSASLICGKTRSEDLREKGNETAPDPFAKGELPLAKG